MIRRSLNFLLSFSLLSRILIVVWIGMGTVYPLAVMAYHYEFLLGMWLTHLDMFLATIVAISVETSALFFLLIMSSQLRVKTKQLKHHKMRLEAVVAERTQTLQTALSELEEVAATDSLTKLHNRRKIKSILREEYRRAARTGREFVIVLLDIDHFKKINDVYGHPAADKVLVAIAHAMNSSTRDIDHVGRLGGEEFLVILPETTLLEAAEVAARMRSTINDINVNSMTCTVSMGLAANTLTCSVEAMIEHADRAMYAAKDAGRDTIRIHSENEVK
jgi:diguanylate cyclase (GGDEF)-like protein